MSQFTANVLFTEFFMISTVVTAIILLLTIILFYLLNKFYKKISFQKRMLLSTGIGIIVGLFILAITGFPVIPKESLVIQEVSA